MISPTSKKPVIVRYALDLAMKLGADAVAKLTRTAVIGAILDGEEWMSQGLSAEGTVRDLCDEYRALTKKDWLAAIRTLEAEAGIESAPVVAKKHLRAVKLDKLEGSTVAGDCPEGAVLIDGHDRGSWTADSQDEAATTGHAYRVYGYSAKVEFGGEERSFEVIRHGVTRRKRKTFLSNAWSFGANLESAASAKARLRVLIAAALAEHEAALEAERVNRELERQTGLPSGTLSEPSKLEGNEMTHHPRSAFGDIWVADGAKVEFAPADVSHWGRFRTYGVRGDRTAAILKDGRRIQVAVSKLSRNDKRFVEAATKGLGTGRMAAQRNGQAWSVGESATVVHPVAPEVIQRALVELISHDASDETLLRNVKNGANVVLKLEADGGDRLTFHAVEGDTGVVTRVTVTVAVERLTPSPKIAIDDPEFDMKVWRELRRCTAQSSDTLSKHLGIPKGIVERALYRLKDKGRTEWRSHASDRVVWIALTPKSR